MILAQIVFSSSHIKDLSTDNWMTMKEIIILLIYNCLPNILYRYKSCVEIVLSKLAKAKLEDSFRLHHLQR